MFKLTIIVLVALVAFTSAGSIFGGATGQLGSLAQGAAGGVIDASSDGLNAVGGATGKVGGLVGGTAGGVASINQHGATVDVAAAGSVAGIDGLANVGAGVNKDGIKVGADGVLAL